MPETGRQVNGHTPAAVVESLLTALETGVGDSVQKPAKSLETEIEGVAVKIKPEKRGRTVTCPQTGEACAKPQKLPLDGSIEIKMCREVLDRLTQARPDILVPLTGLQARPSRNGGGNGTSTNGHAANGARAAGVQPSFDQVDAYLANSTDLVSLKLLKKTLTTRIKILLGGEPEKSYKKKVRNGREYYYEIFWDPVKKKKVDRYVGTKPPGQLAKD